MPDLRMFESLNSLFICKNNISAIPDAVYEMTQLAWLDLSGNQIETVDRKISNMTGLRQLYLNSNKLSHLPGSLGKLTGLHTLCLTGNPLLGNWSRDAVGEEKCGALLEWIYDHYGRRDRCIDAMVTLMLISGSEAHVRLFLPPEIMHIVCSYVFESRYDEDWDFYVECDSDVEELEKLSRLDGRWGDIDEDEDEDGEDTLLTK